MASNRNHKVEQYEQEQQQYQNIIDNLDNSKKAVVKQKNQHTQEFLKNLKKR